jgi:hypothetical protein
MAETATDKPGGVPIWYWIVAGVATLFNAGGVMAYLTSQFDPAGSTAGMTAEQAAYFLSYPAWYVAIYALTTHLSLAGGILLFLRRSWAFHAFGIAALLYAFSIIYHYVLNDVFATLPAGIHAFNAVIGIQLVIFAVFARWATGKGWLR